MQGWVKIHRQLLDNPMWLAEPFTRAQAWIDLLLIANHKDSFFYVRGNKIDVKRGQVGMSEIELSKRWMWSRGKVRRYLNELEKQQQIVQQKSRVKSLVTLVNYDTFQNGRTTDSTTDGQQTVQQTDTNKNDNNIKNDKNDNILSTFARKTKSKNQDREYTKEFNEFWLIYPKKIEKSKAFEAYKKAIKRTTHQQVMDGVKKYAAEVQHTEPRFIKLAQDWFEGEPVTGHDQFQRGATATHRHPKEDPALKTLRILAKNSADRERENRNRQGSPKDFGFGLVN